VGKLVCDAFFLRFGNHSDNFCRPSDVDNVDGTKEDDVDDASGTEPPTAPIVVEDEPLSLGDGC
jgi:hypothetical protein